MSNELYSFALKEDVPVPLTFRQRGQFATASGATMNRCRQDCAPRNHARRLPNPCKQKVFPSYSHLMTAYQEIKDSLRRLYLEDDRPWLDGGWLVATEKVHIIRYRGTAPS